VFWGGLSIEAALAILILLAQTGERRKRRAKWNKVLKTNQQRFIAEAQRSVTPNLGVITQRETMNALFLKYIAPGIPGAMWHQWWDWNYLDDGPQLVWRYRYWWPRPQPQTTTVQQQTRRPWEPNANDLLLDEVRRHNTYVRQRDFEQQLRR
jgi:hypothetical protein